MTTDALRLPQDGAQYAALLTPQGKFLFGFFLLWQEDAVLLDVAGARAEALLQRLTLYKLRSKVSIGMTSLGVGAGWNEPPALPDRCIVFDDPRGAGMGWRVIGEAAVLQAQAGDGVEAYERMRLERAVPDEGVDLLPEKSFLLPYGFEALHGVNFHKGCYVGQEVTARSKHLGSLRKGLYQLRGALPEFGEPILRDGAVAGEMLSSRDGVGLALLSVEMAEKGAVFTTQTGGVVSASVPSWFKNIPGA